MFILRQKLFMGVIAVGSIGWALFLLQSARAGGKVMTGGVSLMCGAGIAVLTVLPAFMVKRWLFTPPTQPQLEAGETIHFSVAASHFLHGEGRGGKLHLTDRGLVFCPHRFNVQLDPWTQPWDKILGASIHNSLVVSVATAAAGMSERGLQNFVYLQLMDGTTARLVIKDRQKVASLIERVRRMPPAERAAALASA
jgi:hypothetical protein